MMMFSPFRWDKRKKAAAAAFSVCGEENQPFRLCACFVVPKRCAVSSWKVSQLLGSVIQAATMQSTWALVLRY